MKSAFFVFVAIIFFPAFVNANVVINEIAWMGDTADWRNEWVELKGDPNKDLSGWLLEASDGSPSVNLDGFSIGLGGFLVLKRGTDYSGFLDNSNEGLTLKDESGNIADSVAPLSDGKWLAGDNATKETMQRSGSGWITAIGTPGVQNAGGESSGSAPEEGSSSSQSSSPSVPTETSFGSVAPTVNSENQYTADAGLDTIVVAGAPHKFEGKAYGFKGEPLDSGADFSWSFGDGGSAKSRIAYHAYSYPGKYRLVFTVVSGRYTASDYITVTAITPAISIAGVKSGSDGFVKLFNDSATDIDLSGWIIDNTVDSFYIPSNTVILAKNYLIIPKEISNIVFPISGTARLLFSNAKVADLLEYSGGVEGNDKSRSSTDVTLTPSITPDDPLAGTAGDIKDDKGSLEDVKEEANEEMLPASDQIALVSEFPSEPSSSIFSSGWFWFSVAAAFGLLSAGAVFAFRKTLQ